MIADELPTKVTASLRSGASPPEAIFSCFVETDREFLETSSSNAGSTANLFLWDPVNYLGHVANAGDTRTVLCRAGVAVDVTRFGILTN